MRWLAAVTLVSVLAAQAPPGRVRSLRILVLSSMLADDGVGEWGFAALVEVDGRRLLFDTGNRPTTVLENARELSVDLKNVPEVILSHNHPDHTGGLLTLRREYPEALRRAHVGTGIFWSRPGSRGEQNPMIDIRKEYLVRGGVFVDHDRAVEIYPGVWLTGPVPRVHPERNFPGGGRVESPAAGLVEDTVPEDMSLVFDTERGLVVLSGCGHAGMVNTLQFARSKVRQAPFYGVVGGFHLFEATDQQLDWTGARLREMGVQNFLGAHCTGIEPVYRLREKLGLGRGSALVGGVSAEFTLESGIRVRRLR